jgi:predicted nuclease with TOPRIM domain
MTKSRGLSQKGVLLAVLVVFGLALLSGCATTQTWPDYERNAENKMVVIQEKIGDGLKTGALTPDQSQMFLTTLKSIRTDYAELRDKRVYREEWNSLFGRLDALENEINRALGRTTRIEEPRNGDKIVVLQRRIDDGRNSGRLPQAEVREFQSRLDSIRSEYFRMTEGGRSTTYEESADISRRLDSLEADLNRFQ